jgi:hypothetical protein
MAALGALDTIIMLGVVQAASDNAADSTPIPMRVLDSRLPSSRPLNHSPN